MNESILTIRYGSEFWRMHPNGQIERPGLVRPSDSWRIVGAVERNKFGAVVRRYSLDDIKARRVPWKHANGKQKSFARDVDHGTLREWTANHSIG